MKRGFCDDIDKLTVDNEDFRRVLYTGEHLQLVLMTLQTGEEIGEEVHEDRDQFFRFEEGQGAVDIDGRENPVMDDFAVIVPAGARHNVRNTGNRAAALLHDLRTARAQGQGRPANQGRRRGSPPR